MRESERMVLGAGTVFVPALSFGGSEVAFEPVLVKLEAAAVLVDDGDWVVVNKPAGMAISVRGVGAGDDLGTALGVSEGACSPAILRSGQMIDDASSGLIVLPRSAHANAAWTRARRAGALCDYLALVDERELERSQRLRHEAERQSVAFVGRGCGVALIRMSTRGWDAPEIRRRMAWSGVPIVGDQVPGARRAWRTMLHLERIRLSGVRLPSAPIPPDFAALLSPEAAGRGAALDRRVFEAAWRRRSLAASSDAYRLVNGEGDGLAGITVDRFADWAVLSLAEDLHADTERCVSQQLVRLGARGVYVKHRVRADLRRCEVSSLAPAVPVMGEPAPDELVVHEGDLRLRVALSEGMSSGLFLDQRENRARLLCRVAPTQRVLNLFSYTCGFSVAAGRAGAMTTNVDLAAPALAWGRRNFELNGLEPGAHEFFKSDAMRWLEGAKRHGRRYHWVVLDPPSFSTSGRGSTFSVAKDYSALARSALCLLEPGGTLLAVTNHRKTSLAKFDDWLRQAASVARRSVTAVEESPSPLDCPSAGNEPTPSKSLWVKVE